MSAHTTVDAHHGATTPDADEPRRPWTIFALMIAAQFMVILDVSVVNVAPPEQVGDAAAEQQQSAGHEHVGCLLYTSPSPRDLSTSRMPSSA